MQIPIVFITGHGDIAMAVHAMQAGAVDFLTSQPLPPTTGGNRSNPRSCTTRRATWCDCSNRDSVSNGFTGLAELSLQTLICGLQAHLGFGHARMPVAEPA